MIDINTLSSITLFEGSSEELLCKFASAAKLQYYKKGTLIFDQAEAGKYFIYSLHGWVKLSRSAADGSEVILDVFNDSHYAGESFIFEPNNEAYCVEAISDVELIVIPIDQLRLLTLENHALSLSLLKATLHKQNKLTMEVEHLSIKSATDRLGCFLLRLCTLKKPKDIVLKLPYDKTLLASRLGIRPETFSRALNKICKEYDIVTDGDTLKIKSMQDLANYVCAHCSQTFPCKDITR